MLKGRFTAVCLSKGMVNTMKKSLFIGILAALLIAAGSGSYAAEAKNGASDGASRISPALDVLAGNLSLTKTGLVAKDITFSPSDFEKTMGVSRLDSITVLTLPDASCGTLYLATTPVMAGQIITRESISSLRFTPAGKEEGDCTFVFGTVSSSQPLAVTCHLYLISTLNFAPASPDVEMQTVATLENIPVYGQLTAEDPENDLLNYRITAYTVNGTLRMIDRKTGEFCYTPLDGFTGEDSFRFVAVDCYGNESEEMTVSLLVEASGASVSYCDMKGNKALLPAMRLAEKGIMIGETIGTSAYFHPEQAVSRSEFLAMTLCAAGIEVPDSSSATAFADDSDIPEYLRKYVAYAAEKKYISGTVANGTSYFYPNQTVTYAEAAVMLQNILGLKASGAQLVFSEEDNVPAWAESAVLAVAEAGLFPEGAFAADSAVNRADAACMLSAVLALQK